MPQQAFSVSTPPTIIDIEASGFGRGSYPIEIGFAGPGGNSFCALIEPPAHWAHWDPAAEAIHHIPRALLFYKGYSPAEVARRLNQALRGQTVYSDGWANDYSWLCLLYDEADMALGFRLENLSALLNDADQAIWHDTKTRVQAELVSPRHRASTDAKVLQQTWLRVKQQQGA